jgi:hypothetical protein
MSGKVVLCIVVSAGISALRCGAAVYHSDGSAASVQGLHNAVLNGDTITIPAGTFTWNTQIHVTKNITLAGAGVGMTIINDNVPKSSGGASTVLMLFTGITGNLRVTGFTVRGQAQDTNNFNQGTIAIGGTSHSVRVDHVKFYRPGTGAIITRGDVWGVIDHCDFDTSSFKVAVQVFLPGYGGGTNGNNSWEAPTNLGSGEGVYIEDCTFLGNGIGGATVTNSSQGGRYVFRHNTITSNQIGSHGTEGQLYRGVRSFEIYQNTFTNPGGIMDTCVIIRGGTGVIWGNTMHGSGGATGYKNGCSFYNYRSFTTFGGPWGKTDGTNPWDQNSDFVGYAAIDQVGRGMALDEIRGNPPINQRTGTAAWPRNQLEPVYVWSNHWTPVPNNPGSYLVVPNSPPIMIGRDVINSGNTPKPGYTPFVYPHPLVTSDPFPTPTPPPTPPPSATQCSLLQQRLDRLQRRQERLERRNRSNPRLKRRIRRLERQLQLQHCP